MKVLVINGSSRGEEGLTHKLVQSFTAGLRSGGADVTVHNLNNMKISPCKGCLKCMHNTHGECVIWDDMYVLYSELKNSDLFVIGTPVYTDNMTALMKVVIDRCMCAMSPFLRRDEDGRTRHEYNWRMPEYFFLLSTCAFPESETFYPLIATYKAQVKNFDCKSAGEICIPGALALITEPQLITERLGMIERSGELIASGEGLSLETSILLNRPILSPAEYIRIASKYEDWCRNQTKAEHL